MAAVRDILLVVGLTAGVCAVGQGAGRDPGGMGRTAGDVVRPPGGGTARSRRAAARVEGRLVAPRGRTLLAGALIVTPGGQSAGPATGNVTLGPDGTFVVRSVPPGRHVIRCRVSTGRQEPSLFGTAAIEVGDQDLTGVEIRLAPGAQISGQVSFESGEPPPPERLAGLRVRAAALDGVPFADAFSAPVASGGQFVLTDVMPGEHELRLEGLPDGWRLRAVYLLGHEVTGRPLALEAAQIVRDLRLIVSGGPNTESGATARRLDGVAP